MTFAVSVIASSVRPWKAWSNVTIACRPVALRATFTAFSTASAPEFANIVFLGESPGVSAFRRSASSMYGSFAVTWKQVCVSRSSWSCAAFTTSGEVWPTFRTAMPVAKSISRFPSTSSMIAPQARAVTIGWMFAMPWGHGPVPALEPLARLRAGDLGDELALLRDVHVGALLRVAVGAVPSFRPRPVLRHAAGGPSLTRPLVRIGQSGPPRAYPKQPFCTVRTIALWP